MKKYKRIICILMVVATLVNVIGINAKKASAIPVAIPIAKVAWDVVGTLLVVMAGYQLNEIVTGKDSPDALTVDKIDSWEESGQMTLERKEFVKSHFGANRDKVMRESVARDFVGNLTNEEFTEIKELTNPNRDPKIYKFPDFKGISNALNLSIFAKIYEYFRSKMKERYDVKKEFTVDYGKQPVFRAYFDGWMMGYNEIEMYELRYDFKKVIYDHKVYYPAICLYTNDYDVFVTNVNQFDFFQYAEGKKIFKNGAGTDSVGTVTNAYRGSMTNISICTIPMFNNLSDYNKYIVDGTLPENEWRPNNNITYDNIYNNKKTEIPEDGGQDLTTYINNYYYNTYEGDITKIVGNRSVQDSTVNPEIPFEPETDYTGLFGNVIEKLVEIKNAILSIPDTFKEWLDKIYDAIISIPTHIDNFFNWVKTSWNDLIESIEGIPSAISTGFKNIVQDLFVPDSIAIQEIVEHMDNKIKNQTGVLTYPLSLVILFLNNVMELGVNDCILVMPQLKLNGYILSERYEFNFTQFVKRSEFFSLYQIFRTISNFIMILGVLTLAIKKGDQVIRGS